MVVDSSAVVAVIAQEPERTAFLRVIQAAPGVLISAASYLETAILVDQRADVVLSRSLDTLLAELGIEVVAVTPEQAVVARTAYRDFGKGAGHPAGLDVGDCLSYPGVSQPGDPPCDVWGGTALGDGGDHHAPILPVRARSHRS